MFGLGTPEITIIALLAILFFGAGALPKLAKSMGQAKKEFEKGVNEGEGTANKTNKEDDEKSAN